MKITNKEFDRIADRWSGAYRADYQGREVSIQIIKALFAFGFSERDAEWLYFSKWLRWFFDSRGDRVSARQARALFTDFLGKRIKEIKTMFSIELGRKLTLS